MTSRLAAVLACLLSCNTVFAQNLTITSARIIDGDGHVIESGSVVIRDGRVALVSQGVAPVEGVHIDAAGASVLPGFIDTHIHLRGLARTHSQAAVDRWMASDLPDLMGSYLAMGLTTVMSAGDYTDEVLEIRQRLRDGDLRGPRLLVVGPTIVPPEAFHATVLCATALCRQKYVFEVSRPDVARGKVAELAAAGVDAIKAVFDGGRGPKLSEDVLRTLATEARRQGVPLIVHSTAVEDMQRALELGASRFVHTPLRGDVASMGVAARLRAAGVPVASTVALNAPMVAADGTIGHAFGYEYNADTVAMNQQSLRNVRALWDAGVVVAFGSDQPPQLPPDLPALLWESRALGNALSNEEVITALTRNAAVYLGLDEDLGTLAPGKVADIVIVDGDPLSDLSDLANVQVVIQGGSVVVDTRGGH